MQTNPFPAILIAGPPHSGKSVLSYLLTDGLRKMNVSHYLLRAVPDGEGDWFQVGPRDAVQALRVKNKHGYEPGFVAHMRRAIENRHLPLLVDIGGKPQGEQFDLIRACTHAILLYKEEAECLEWRSNLAKAGLQPLAELRSSLDSDEDAFDSHPLLTGTIGGLERNADERRAGSCFGALLDRVSGVFHYEELDMERILVASAPLEPLIERKLATELNIRPVEKRITWEPEHLSQLALRVPAGQPFALYGRGPVWLAAMLAAHARPAPLALFDVRFGWMAVPDVRAGRLDVEYALNNNDIQAVFKVSGPGFLEPGALSVSMPPDDRRGVILNGQLPRWAYASLARFYAETLPWVAVHDASQNRNVVVFSRDLAHPLGQALAH